ncbi:Fc.00g078160.m01.CDS01 [Cosmosporella sp. VM-42]
MCPRRANTSQHIHGVAQDVLSLEYDRSEVASPTESSRKRPLAAIDSNIAGIPSVKHSSTRISQLQQPKGHCKNVSDSLSTSIPSLPSGRSMVPPSTRQLRRSKTGSDNVSDGSSTTVPSLSSGRSMVPPSTRQLRRSKTGSDNASDGSSTTVPSLSSSRSMVPPSTRQLRRSKTGSDNASNGSSTTVPSLPSGRSVVPPSIRQLQQNQKGSDGPLSETYNKPLPQELQSIRLTAYPRSPDRNWTDPTILDLEFWTRIDRFELLIIAKYFSVRRSEDDLHQFLEAIRTRIPPESGWIWPLLDQFNKQKDKTVVVILLHCPLREKTTMTSTDDPCFTDEFVTGLGKCFNNCGADVLRLDLRKQCRRNHKDNHCQGILAREQYILALATAIEMLIATNVFGIRIHSTVAFSKEVAGTRRSIDTIHSWDASLLGRVHRILWHPRVLFSRFTHSVALENVVYLLRNDIAPIIYGVAKDLRPGSAPILGFECLKELMDYCALSQVQSVTRIFKVRQPRQNTKVTHTLSELNKVDWSETTLFKDTIRRIRRSPTRHSERDLVLPGFPQYPQYPQVVDASIPDSPISERDLVLPCFPQYPQVVDSASILDSSISERDLVLPCFPQYPQVVDSTSILDSSISERDLVLPFFPQHPQLPQVVDASIPDSSISERDLVLPCFPQNPQIVDSVLPLNSSTSQRDLVPPNLPHLVQEAVKGFPGVPPVTHFSDNSFHEIDAFMNHLLGHVWNGAGPWLEHSIPGVKSHFDPAKPIEKRILDTRKVSLKRLLSWKRSEHETMSLQEMNERKARRKAVRNRWAKSERGKEVLLARLQRRRISRSTEEAKAKERQYRLSHPPSELTRAKNRERMVHYSQSEAGKAAAERRKAKIKKFGLTPEAKAKRKESYKKFNASEKGKANMKRGIEKRRQRNEQKKMEKLEAEKLEDF